MTKKPEQIVPGNKSRLEIKFGRFGLLRFALGIIIGAFYKDGNGRQLTVRAEDGKLIEIVFVV